MIWQDTLIATSNFGLFIALIPLLFATVFGIKTIEVSLVATGFITAFFLALIGIAIFSLGATWGAYLTFMNGIVWFIIGLAALRKSKTKNPQN